MAAITPASETVILLTSLLKYLSEAALTPRVFEPKLIVLRYVSSITSFLVTFSS